VITSRSAARVAGCGSQKTVPASDGSESKHEHASRRWTALFPLEKRRALGLLRVGRWLSRYSLTVNQISLPPKPPGRVEKK
jgi:hypothetical protein